MADLTKDERFLLEWLAKEDFSQYGECYGKSLDSLISKGLVQVHGPGEHQSFIAKGTSLMYRAVSLTEAGIAKHREQDTPTPAELARLADAIVTGRELTGKERGVIAAALSRLSQVEQDADQRAATVLAAPGGLTVHCIRWADACSEKRVLKERAEKAEQGRDASDALVWLRGMQNYQGRFGEDEWRCLECGRGHSARGQIANHKDNCTTAAALKRHRSRQKAERT